jgi:hypothetical protein
MSASWPVAGDDLRMGLGESGQFPTGVKEVVTLWVKLRREHSLFFRRLLPWPGLELLSVAGKDPVKGAVVFGAA